MWQVGCVALVVCVFLSIGSVSTQLKRGKYLNRRVIKHTPVLHNWVNEVLEFVSALYTRVKLINNVQSNIFTHIM